MHYSKTHLGEPGNPRVSHDHNPSETFQNVSASSSLQVCPEFVHSFSPVAVSFLFIAISLLSQQLFSIYGMSIFFQVVGLEKDSELEETSDAGAPVKEVFVVCSVDGKSDHCFLCRIAERKNAWLYTHQVGRLGDLESYCRTYVTAGKRQDLMDALSTAQV